MLWASVVALTACSPGGEQPPATPSGISDAQARIELKLFIDAQRLTQARLSLFPSEHDWGFVGLAQSRQAVGPADGGSTWPSTILAYRSAVPGTRPCHVIGAYSVRVATSDDCPGDWLAYRADRRSTGASAFRLNWSGRPREVISIPLEVKKYPDPLRLLAHTDPMLGDRLYLNNGSALEAYRADGSLAWRQDGLGIGEIIDVTDLDGDGRPEVIFSPGSRWKLRNPSGKGPGELIVLSAASGEVLWRHAFVGIEFGLNRRRTTIAPNPDGPGKSIYAVMTYSPHLWRFDFSAGAANGAVRWKSPPMVYDSPDKAPVIADFDGDGTDEIVVDSYATLYVFRQTDGSLVSRSPYAANRLSFGGFLAAADLDGDGRPEIVGLSNSPYMKDAFAARYENGAFRVLWRREFEEGLAATSFELRPLSGLVEPAGSTRPLMAWSLRDLSDGGAPQSLEVTDAGTGQVIARLSGAMLLGLLRGPDGAYKLVSTAGDDALTLTELTQLGLGKATRVPATRWNGVARLGRPSFSTGNHHAASVAPFLDEAGRSALLVLLPGGQVAARLLGDGSTFDGPLYYFEGVQAPIVTSASGQIARPGPDLQLDYWAHFEPQVFGTPVAADLDNDGRRELVVPFRSGTGIVRRSPSGGFSVEPLIERAPEQQRESFHVPLVARVQSREGDGNTSDRIVVGYSDSGPRALTARDATGRTLWNWTLPATNWEPSLVIGANAHGDQTIFFNDSRTTAALDPSTGATRWAVEVQGQCQRQIAAIDWNDDGFPDVALQAAETVYVLDGRNGASLSEHIVWASYGGYVAATRNGGEPAIGVFGAGGLALVDAKRGLLADELLDDRKVESIPPVIGRRHGKGGTWLYNISGGGLLRRLTTDGTERVQVDLAVPVLSMTGAYVNDDNYIDLLVSTYRGEVIAISGDTLQELWRVQLGGAAGPAVATDIDGDGKGELVVISGDGMLRVLAPEGPSSLPRDCGRCK